MIFVIFIIKIMIIILMILIVIIILITIEPRCWQRPPVLFHPPVGETGQSEGRNYDDNDDTEDGDYRTCQFKGRSYDDNRDCDGDFDAKKN